MKKNERPRPVFNTLMDVAALVSVFALILLAILHTSQYMELIFEESGGGPLRWSRNIAAGFVEASIVGSLVIIVYIRGTGEGDDDDPDGKKTPSEAGSVGRN